MRHLCDLRCLLAKQVLSQLSYTPAAFSFYCNFTDYHAARFFERSKNVVLLSLFERT